MQAKPEDLRTSLLDMASGGFKEVVDYEVSKVFDNIMDVNTKATAKRKVTVTMEFQPDDSRANVRVATVVKTSLATVNPVTTTLYVAGENSTGEVQVVEMTPQIPGQTSMDAGEQPAPLILKLIQPA